MSRVDEQHGPLSGLSFGESRFKVPAVPFLVIASAVAMVAAVDAVRGQSRRLSSTSREITGASRPVP